MTLFWLVVPALLTFAGLALVVVVRRLDDARRELHLQVLTLGESRASLLALQRRIDATNAAAPARTHR